MYTTNYLKLCTFKFLQRFWGLSISLWQPLHASTSIGHGATYKSRRQFVRRPMWTSHLLYLPSLWLTEFVRPWFWEALTTSSISSQVRWGDSYFKGLHAFCIRLVESPWWDEQLFYEQRVTHPLPSRNEKRWSPAVSRICFAIISSVLLWQLLFLESLAVRKLQKQHWLFVLINWHLGTSSWLF